MSRTLRPTAPIGILILAALLLIPAAPSAAPPQTIKVQGSLTDRISGTPAPAQGVFNMTFALFDNEFGGLPITTIGPLPVDVAQGRFQVELPLSTAQFQVPDRYLAITVNGEILTPRIRLTSAPFALVADQSQTAATSSTAGVALTVAPGGVATASIAPGAVTSDKLGIPCATGEILVRSGSAWVCAPQPQAGTVCAPGSFASCYGGPAGTLNVGGCRAGASHCNAAGTAFEGCEGQVLPAAEVCDAADNNCDGAVDEANICPPCPDVDQDGYPDGACIGGTDCNDQVSTIHPGRPELCNGVDDDCSPQTADGSGDPNAGTLCDGADPDLCIEGVRFCAAGTFACTDTTPGQLEICNGIDDDCNGDLPLDERDVDGDGVKACGGDCNDNNAAVRPGALEICDTLDNDCNPNTPNGVTDPLFGTPCDGTDADLCQEGTRFCGVTGVMVCNDNTTGLFDVCNNLDDDCDPSSPDGSEDPFIGACDGPDSDFCVEGYRTCVNGTLVCGDTSSDSLDLCNAVNDDCDNASADGSEDPAVGTPCDGPDADLCLEGTRFCSGGALGCTDTTGNSPEICGDAIDNDCDGETDEGC